MGACCVKAELELIASSIPPLPQYMRLDGHALLARAYMYATAALLPARLELELAYRADDGSMCWLYCTHFGLIEQQGGECCKGDGQEPVLYVWCHFDDASQLTKHKYRMHELANSLRAAAPPAASLFKIHLNAEAVMPRQDVSFRITI